MKKVLFSLAVVLGTGLYAQCNPVSEINEDFDGWAEIDECWTGIANGGMFLVEGNVTFYSFMNTNSSMYLISPEVTAGEYTLNFDFATASMTGEEVEGITIEAGTVTGNENVDSYVSISEPVATTVAVQNFSTPVSISGDAKYFVIKVSSVAPHSAALIDNLVLEPQMGVSDANGTRISAYPNPVVNQLNLTSESRIKEVKIFGLNGQLVKVQKANATSARIEVSGLNAGIYIAQIFTDKGVETIKVVKK